MTPAKNPDSPSPIFHKNALPTPPDNLWKLTVDLFRVTLVNKLMWDLIALSPQLGLAFSDIYLELLSTKKINCNWAYKTDGGLKLTTVTIINLNFTSGEKNAWSSISARKAGFLLSHVSCSIVLTCRVFFPELFIYLLHLYKPLCFFLPKQTRKPSLSNLFFPQWNRK